MKKVCNECVINITYNYSKKMLALKESMIKENKELTENDTQFFKMFEVEK